MGHLRERFNARARKSSRPAKRAKHGHVSSEAAEASENPNAEIHVPKSTEVKEAERRERLRQELLEQQQNSKFTSKKKKRLEKYIDKKLKKEERVEILKKLAETQEELPSLQLQPSSILGSRKSFTHQDLRDGLHEKQARKILSKKRQRHNAPESDSDSDTDLDNALDGSNVQAHAAVPLGSTRESPVIVKDEEPQGPKSTVSIVSDTVVGSALRRNADGTVAAPVVIKRKPKGHRTAFRSWGATKAKEECAASDYSFDSSDSANDSSSEEGADDSEEDDHEGSDSNGSESETNSGDRMVVEEPAKKLGGFKDWAVRQLSAAKEYVAPPIAQEEQTSPPPPPENKPSEKVKPASRKEDPREMQGPLGEDLQQPDTLFAFEVLQKRISLTEGSNAVKTLFVTIERSDEIQASRLALPILAEEQAIIEAIRFHPVIVLCGATGSGKTTQVPQFLYESGFGSPGSDNPGMIGITQPRRVAAMSMASRVGKEMALESKVAYQIRYDTTVAPTTAIKFMTDGVLLRELAIDFTLKKYSVIIVDEAHERSVNTDILIGVLSRVVNLRAELWKEGAEGLKPLRLVIMSATLRVSDFTENTSLFPTPPPVISVDARQHPVAMHFARRTYPDYVSEAIKKASKIHARLPPGGILIFLTGQNEITGVCRKLETRYGGEALELRKNSRKNAARRRQLRDDDNDEAPTESRGVVRAIADIEVEELEIEVDAEEVFNVEDESTIAASNDPEALDTDEDEDLKSLGIDAEESETPMHILPLYSILPTHEQMKVFQEPPTGTRLVVVATNVAETSLTIPGIRYVIDCGRAKERCYDASSGVQSFRVNWISKASANQRAGRAGRTGPGHCYRLYSSAVFENHFDKFASPEIIRIPVEGVVLQMKAMNIDVVSNFPFPTPPDRAALKKGEMLLTRLGALNMPKLVTATEASITELGRAMSLFPLSPRFARMIVSGRQHGCLPYVISIVAALSVGDPFIHEENLMVQPSQIDEDNETMPSNDDEEKRSQRRAFFKSQAIHSKLGKGASDVFRLLSVVGAYEYAGGGTQFCQEHFVRPKAMDEIHKLRAQLSNMVSSNFSNLDVGLSNKLKPPNDLQLKVIRQLLCSAFIDQVAIRKDVLQNTALSGSKFASCRGIPYRAVGIDEDVFIHPSSVLYGFSPPDYVVFQDAVKANQLWLKNLTVVNPTWLAMLGKHTMCTFGKPAKNSAGVPMVIPHFGPDNWELPPIKLADVQ